MAEGDSYGVAARSSLVVGAGQVAAYACGLVRSKALALVLGPAGVGLFGFLNSASGLIGTVTSVGISSSGVREVADASNSHEPNRLVTVVWVLRRAALICGLVGWAVAIGGALPLSYWSFQSKEVALDVAVLGVGVFFSALGGAETAILQGTRRIGMLVRANALGVMFGTGVSVAAYYVIGKSGIALGISGSAAATYGCAWWYTRQLGLARNTHVKRDDIYGGLAALLKLGAAFMWGSLLTAAVAVVTRTLVIRYLGIDANGFYQAAWALSGLFANFVLSAMAADFYPRLTTVGAASSSVTKIVNQQTEIGLLLALPGIIATFALSSLLVHLLYSIHFAAAVPLLKWFLVGVFLRVISWPIGYILIAQKRTGWLVSTETCANALHLMLIVALLPKCGIEALGIAFCVLSFAHACGMYGLASYLMGFRWDKRTLVVVAWATLGIVTALTIGRLPRCPQQIACDLLLIVAVAWACARALVGRLESHQHWIQKALGYRWVRVVLWMPDPARSHR